LVGTVQEVLVEGRARRGNLLQSRTRTNKVVLFEGPDELVGSYLNVRLTGTTGATFSALPVRERQLAVVG
jgi:tRNA-2-methylthio-N6-dimethylallyladenosine synthase